MLQQAWNLEIPVRICLTNADTFSVEQPAPVYVRCLWIEALLPRVGYLYSLVPLCLLRFSRYLSQGSKSPWFEYRNLPLKWNIPTGVLFDLLASEEDLPWELNIRFQNYPGDDLPPFNGEDSLKTALMNSLKEASFILRGSAAKVLELNQDAKSEIWRAVAAGGAEAYARAAGSLQLAPVPVRGARPQVPLRVLMRDAGAGTPSSWRAVQTTSRPSATISASTDGDQGTEPEELSLRQALLEVLQDAGFQDADDGDLHCTICGLRPNLDTKLVAMHAALTAGDGFLYAVLRTPPMS